MKKQSRFVRGFLGAALVLMALAAPAVAAEAPEGFVPLFNGKDLTGWSGDPTLWRVEGGVIVGSTDNTRIEHNTFLSTEKEYSDFILRAKVKLRNHNSGIQFRSEQMDDYVVAGYQADIAEKTYFGMLYEERKRGFMPYWETLSQEEKDAIQAVVKHGDWNEFEILAEGDHIKLTLNGKVSCDIQDPDGAKRGVIALQLHAGDPMEVRFKDIYIKELNKDGAQATLIPDVDAWRTARLRGEHSRFVTPEGFSVEEVATHELLGSVINLTFDHLGRPVVSAEGKGIRTLLDEDGDGRYESQKSFCEEVSTAMGLCFIAPGDLLVHANGPHEAGLYRLTDVDGDDVADEVTLIANSNGGIGEHGPHAIVLGPDGDYYIMFGNHSHPGVPPSPFSPSRGLQEDHLLPRYVDPRGHANNILAPGGTICRLSSDLIEWSQVVAGFRNAYDFDFNAAGEMFTFDSDMEWDIGQPWFRPVRVIHAVPGADFGWRTGSSKMPAYYIDTLPALDDVGRGSPVGTVVYDAYRYPQKFQGAFFMGDWSRGRIRVLFPERTGATYRGVTMDFVVGEPLNVTDVDISPDGYLYFTVGGRQTHGGLYKVNYDGDARQPDTSTPAATITSLPLPRSIATRHYVETQLKPSTPDWERVLTSAAQDRNVDPARRVKALEALQLHGPKPSFELLAACAEDPDPEVRGFAVFLMGTYPLHVTREFLMEALTDDDPYVIRRACESLVRAGLDPASAGANNHDLANNILAVLGHEDRFVRYAARLALMRVPQQLWKEQVLSADFSANPHAALEGLLAFVNMHYLPEESDAIFARLQAFSEQSMTDDVLLDYLRVLQLAYLRDKGSAPRDGFNEVVAPRLLAKFPGADWRVNRELQVVLAHQQYDKAIEPMLAYLTPDKPQEEQIHTVYALRAIESGWTKAQREQFIAWFDRARAMSGGASFEGFIENLWTAALALLPEAEKAVARQHRQELIAKENAEALALLEQMEKASEQEIAARGELAQMSFDEMSEFLEYDPMAYKVETAKHGREVFVRSKCATCHVFGTVGKGGGPDLSTVVSRFRRRDILEAIMYPSKVVSDQYSGVELDLDDLSTVTGMVASENDTAITIITINGERIEVPKSSILERRVVHESMMPEGLLATMSLNDLIALINFLEHGVEESPKPPVTN